MLSRRLFLILVGLGLWYSAWCLMEANEYMKTKDFPVEVKQIYSGTGSGKYSRMEFIAIYQAQDGTIFDRNISAASFYQLEPGDKVILQLRQYDIRQTWKDNTIWFFGALMYYLVTGVFGAGFIVLAFWPDRRKVK